MDVFPLREYYYPIIDTLLLWDPMDEFKVMMLFLQGLFCTLYFKTFMTSRLFEFYYDLWLIDYGTLNLGYNSKLWWGYIPKFKLYRIPAIYLDFLVSPNTGELVVSSYNDA